MTILLVGHLDTEVAPSLGFTDARLLDEPAGTEAVTEIAEGIRQAKPDVDLRVVPAGPGKVAVQALSSLSGDPYLISAGRDGEGWFERQGVGEVIIEMGHDLGHDGGQRILNRLGLLADRRPLTIAASTSRPLVGPGSTSSIGPDLKPRSQVLLPVLAEGTAELPGSGAGGGAAAKLAGRGGRLVDTGRLLAERLELDNLLNGAKIVVVAHPFWHAPDLADAPELEVAERAQARALPVVGVGIASSLSGHELAEAGVHGVHLRRPGKSWRDLGIRVARTWAADFAG